MENTELTTEQSNVSIFSSMDAFTKGKEIAKMLSEAELVPQAYKNNIPNTMIALEMANRINISPFQVMQNLDIINGKPSWSSTFIISALNSCGRFSPLRFKFEGEKKTDEFGCRAFAKDLDTEEVLEGPLISWTMVKAEGWLNKKGSKWRTMPELMFQYRAASFFGRLYAPDILKGMHSVQENIDISGVRENIKERKLQELTDYYNNNEFDLSEDDKIHIDRIIKNKEHLNYAKAMKALESKIIKQ